MSETSSNVGKGCILLGFFSAALLVTGAGAFLAFRTPATPDHPPASASPKSTAQAPQEEDVPPPPVAAGDAVARVKARGRLLVGMDTGEPPGSGTPPMYFVDAAGGRDGFDYVLSRRIADAVGVNDVEIVHAKYSGLEDLLVDPAKKVDVIVSGYSPDETAGVAFSESYLEYGLCLVVRADSGIHTTNDLFGKAVGIFDDDAAAEDVKHLVKGYSALTRMEDGYWDALAAKKFDGFLYDYPYTAAELGAWAKAPGHAGVLKIVQYNLTESTYAVGVRADEPDLLGAVNQAIERWRASDDYATAIKRYLKGGEAAPVAAGAKTVTVKAGDTLSRIAAKELGSADRWKELWAKNRARFPNPNLIEVGDLVELP